MLHEVREMAAYIYKMSVEGIEKSEEKSEEKSDDNVTIAQWVKVNMRTSFLSVK